MTLICVIGLPRSGTTLLGRALAGLPGAVYHEEPNPMWRFRNFRRLGHEQFAASDATDEVRRYIRSILLPGGAADDGHLVIEKTPANCIRSGFVEALVPEAKFLFLTRDSAAIRQSMLKKWRGGIDENASRLDDDVRFRALRAKFAKSRYIHRSEKLHYVGAELAQRWARLRSGHTDYWGPVIPGWQELRGLPAENVVDKVCSHMETTFKAGMSSCGVPHAILSYEALVTAPREELQRALSEIDVAVPDLSPALVHFRR